MWIKRKEKATTDVNSVSVAVQTEVCLAVGVSTFDTLCVAVRVAVGVQLVLQLVYQETLCEDQPIIANPCFLLHESKTWIKFTLAWQGVMSIACHDLDQYKTRPNWYLAQQDRQQLRF